MHSFEQARTIILEHVVTIGSERISLLEAGGRVLAEDFYAPAPMPAWDNSAMDGFAVRHEECSLGSTLEITDYLPAGKPATNALQSNTAARIMTGAPMPYGADAVIPFEDTTEENNHITITHAVQAGDHIRFKAEDINAGECILSKGAVLRPAEIALLASFNQLLVTVYRRPQVAILATGDELVEPGGQPEAGQIVNSNSFALATALRELGINPVLLGIARDNLDSHLEVMTEGLKADVLITTAGVSAGDRDLVRDVLSKLSVKEIFWKVNIKPGRPTAFALKGKTPIFSLPGNPVSTMITFEEFVRPALLKMMGCRQVLRPMFTAIIQEDVQKKAGRTRFLRVKVCNSPHGYCATQSGDQNTGILKTMIQANAIAILPAEPDFIPAGTAVEVHFIDETPF
jgi:molybdopterin molybdotransferase